VLSSKQTPFIVGVVMMALFGVAVLFGLNATHGSPLAERKVVKVVFSDMNGLNPGDDVRIASTRVGFVDDMKLQDGRAVAILKLDDPDTVVHQDATARISDRSGLGQKFVNLDPGTKAAGVLASGATLPVKQTIGAEDINELFNTFDEKTRDAASTTLTNLGGGMIGRADDMHAAVGSAPGLLEDLGTVSSTLAKADGSSLVGFLQAADTLSARFTDRDQEIADLTRQLGTTLKAMGVDEGDPLKNTLKEGPSPLDAPRTALDSLNEPLADTESAMTRLRPGATALGDSVPDLRGLLRESVKPLRRMPDVNRQAEPAVEDLTGLIDDARPLARQLVKTGDSAAPPAAIFGQYADEGSNYDTQTTDTLSHGDAAGHWLRIMILPGMESVAGLALPVPRNPYPGPGEAALDKSRASGGIR
jgi:phospholipid/cholesterol/gamma-HCH transport system substrate-binding protein